jgi:hypothetical protein
MRRLPDPDLIALARKGSVEAAGALFDRYWVHAWTAAYAVAADQSLADDSGVRVRQGTSIHCASLLPDQT